MKDDVKGREREGARRASGDNELGESERVRGECWGMRRYANLGTVSTCPVVQTMVYGLGSDRGDVTGDGWAEE